MKNVTDRVNQEDQNMLREGAIVVLDLNEDRFFNSFLVKKTNGGNRSVVNLKDQVFFLLNVVTRGQKMHDRPKGCHIPEERPSL